MNYEGFKKLNGKHLSDGLRGLRLIHGHTLEDLSEYLNKDIGYLSRLENGKASPKLDTITFILSFYDLTIKEFYDQLDDLI
jgi:transcriptional regulator with XRE-family HTH domain